MIASRDGRSDAADGLALIHGQYDWAETAPSTAFVETVAEASDVHPADLDALPDAAALAAIDSLLTGESESTLRLTVQYGDTHVTMDDAGQITVERPCGE